MHMYTFFTVIGAWQGNSNRFGKMYSALCGRVGSRAILSTVYALMYWHLRHSRDTTQIRENVRGRRENGRQGKVEMHV